MIKMSRIIFTLPGPVMSYQNGFGGNDLAGGEMMTGGREGGGEGGREGRGGGEGVLCVVYVYVSDREREKEKERERERMLCSIT